MRLSHTPLFLGLLASVSPAQTTSWFAEVHSGHITATSRYVRVVDVDRDGDLDLIETEKDELIVERNDGKGRFRATRTAIPGLQPGHVTAIDADGDSDFDLVTYDVLARAAVLLENDGRGNYRPSAIRTPTIDSRGPYAVTDVDGDGRQDLWLPRSSGMELWRNAGPAGFQDWTSRLPAQRPHLVLPLPQVADLDGDGDDDVAFLSNSTTLTVIETVSPGVFRLARTNVTEAFSSFAIGDLDGDGRPDLAGTRTNGVSLYRNQGAFRFQSVQASWLPAGVRPAALLTLADVDGDQDPDLLLSRSGSTGDMVSGDDVLLLNDRGQRFLVGPSLPAPFGTTWISHAADFDGDGRTDLIRPALPVAKLAFGVGGGRFDDASGFTIDELRASLVFSADLDRDGQAELLAVTSSGINVLRRSPAGRFEHSRSIRPAAPLGLVRDVTAIDYDGDGDHDLFLAIDGLFSGAQDRLLRNDGAAGFVEVTGSALGIPPTKAYAAIPLDANGDGRMDLFVVDRDPNATSRLLLNQGGRLVDAPGAVPSSADGFCAVAADCNGDGRPDLVVSGTNTRLLLNQGGRFTLAAANFPAGTTLQTVSAGDVDGDGDVDLMSTSGRSVFLTGPHQLWINDGRGQFQLRALPTPGGLGMTSGCMLDFDGDGDLDFAASTVLRPVGSPPIHYLQNDGTGRFLDISANQFQPGFPVLELRCFDADADGDPDLLARREGAVVLYNQSVDLRVPFRVAPGETLQVEARAASAGPIPATAVFVAAHDLATRPLQLSVGLYRLDPTTSLLWTSRNTQGGVATAALLVPPLPVFRGQSLAVQALMVMRSGTALQLTTAQRITIRR